MFEKDKIRRHYHFLYKQYAITAIRCKIKCVINDLTDSAWTARFPFQWWCLCIKRATKEGGVSQAQGESCQFPHHSQLHILAVGVKCTMQGNQEEGGSPYHSQVPSSIVSGFCSCASPRELQPIKHTEHPTTRMNSQRIPLPALLTFLSLVFHS